jgi:hypothetical protein
LQIFFNSISGGKVPEGYRAGLEQVITKLILSGMGFSGAVGDESLNLALAGDGSYAQTASGTHFDSLTTNNSFSVSFWQYSTGFGNTSAFWLQAPTADGGQRGAQAHTPWANGTIFFDQSGCCDGPERMTTTGALADVWQHFVFQKDGAGNREIWLDGVLAASAAGGDASDPFDGILTIGAEGPTMANSFGGRIDEMAIWNTALDASEIGLLAGGAVTSSLVPEPSGILLGLLGLLTFGLRRRR